MQELISISQNIVVLGAALVVQYFLIKSSRDKLGFILPGIYLGFAVLTAVNIILTGTALIGGVAGTALMGFLTGTVPALMLLIMWWKREFDTVTIIIAVFAIYILSNIFFMVLALIAGFFFG